MKEGTKGKGPFDGIKILRIPEDFNPVRLIPADIPPVEFKPIEFTAIKYRGRPKQEKNNKEETK